MFQSASVSTCEESGSSVIAAIVDVSTTRSTLGARAAASSTSRVPRTAGSTRSRRGSFTVGNFGLARWTTYHAPAMPASQPLSESSSASNSSSRSLAPGIARRWASSFSFARLRTLARTRWPRARRLETTCAPMKPVAPETVTRVDMGHDDARSRAPVSVMLRA